MRSPLGRRIALAALALLAATPARAAFEDIGAGARAPGMGNAFVAIADDVYALYYNPAGLALLKKPEFGTSYSRLFMGLSDNSQLNNSFLGYAHPLRGGEEGTVAGGWQQFSLSGLYQENTYSLSYGRLLTQKLWIGDLYGGASLKYLNRSFGSFPEENNPQTGNGLPVAPGVSDPVLAGRKSVGVPDADLGLLYRLPQQYSAGLFVGHVLRPNVAFSPDDTDRLAPSVKLAVNYRSLISNVGVQLEEKTSPIGTQDHTIAVAAERWFPRLFIGDFAFRGALAAGSREFKQITLGLGYRTQRFTVDYGFVMPINSVASTAGSHRVSLSFRFGKAGEPDESVEMILDAMRQLKAGTVPSLQAAGKGLSAGQKALIDEYLAHFRALTARAGYQPALVPLSKAMALSPNDAQILKEYGLLNFVTQFFKELPDYRSNAAHFALHQGILAFLAGNNLEAVEKTDYALSLDTHDKAVEEFLGRLELATGIQRPAAKTGPKPDQEIEDALARASEALDEGRYEEAIRESEWVLKKDETRVGAWENLGMAHFAMGDLERSLAYWQKALSFEKDLDRRAKHRSYIRSIENLLKKRKPAPPKVQKTPVDAAEVLRLYNQGIDAYSSGRLDEAERAFEAALEMDPDNVPAGKALRRVREEMGLK